MKKAIFAMALFSVAAIQLGPAVVADATADKIINIKEVAKVTVAEAPVVAVPEPAVAEQAPAPPPAPEPIIVEVQKGDNLTKIAKVKDTTYQRIYEANPSISHPDVINPGDKLRVPFPDEQLPARPLPTTPVAAPVVTAIAKPIAKAIKPAAVKKPALAAPAVAGGSVWDQLAKCESGGNWAINTGNGYYGGLQFTLATWRGVGGSGYPHQASREEQIMRAEILLARSGWGQWPACTTKLGLR